MKNALVSIVLCLLCLTIYNSCRKNIDKNLSFSGLIVNEFNDNPQSDVKVSLYANQTSSNGVVGKPKLIAESISNSEGKFNLSFDRGNVIAYEVFVEGEAVFPYSFDLDPDKITDAKNLTENIPVKVISYIQVHLKNVNTAGSTDRFNIGTSIDLGCACCPKAATQFVGVIDTTYVCSVPAGLDVVFNSTVQDGNGLRTLSNTINCEKGNVCTLEIEY